MEPYRPLWSRPSPLVGEGGLAKRRRMRGLSPRVRCSRRETPHPSAMLRIASTPRASFARLAPTRGEGKKPLSYSNFQTATDTRSYSRGVLRPRFANNIVPPKYRGRREDRVRAAPAVSCAICTRKCAHEHTGSAETLRPSLRNGFTAYSALSPATGFLATVVSRA